MQKTLSCHVLLSSLSSMSKSICGISSIQSHRSKKMLHLSSIMAGFECRRKSAADTEMSSRKEYQDALIKLNELQSNAASIALFKHQNPKQILPLFGKQLELAGLKLDDLDKLKVIHVGGTKGKGSTSAFVESIVRHSGRKTGFYNSPHLVKVTERIKINGQPIDELSFSRYFQEIYHKLQTNSRCTGVQMPGYFSFLTILAFHIFIQEKVDCVVLEVGIGGEYDPTNIIRQPVVCGISTLDYDHTNILGETMEQIAWNKAGICKPGTPLITVEHDHKKAMEIIRSRAEEKNCPVYVCNSLVAPEDFQLGIEGSAQKINASLAYQLASFFMHPSKVRDLPGRNPTNHLRSSIYDMEPFVRGALAKCFWPGRCHLRKLPGAVFFLDGAHTTKSMQNCLDWFLSRSRLLNPHATKVLLVNVVGERNRRNILAPLAESKRFVDVIFCPNRLHCLDDSVALENTVQKSISTNDKSMDNVQLNAQIWSGLVQEKGTSASPVKVFKDTFTSIEHIKSMIDSSGEHHVLVTGSLHFVGAILETLDSCWLRDTVEHPSGGRK